MATLSRAHVYRRITDSDGNIVPNTTVTIYEAGTTQLLAQTLWQNDVGSQAIPNPFVTSNGYLEFFLDVPKSVRVGLVVQGSTETFIDDVPVLPAPENMVTAVTGFQVTNAPAAGYFLQAGQPGAASWVNAGDLVNSKPTQLVTLKSYDWSNAFLDDATVVDATGANVVPLYPDVTADTKPTGYTFTKAIQMPTSGVISVKLPAQNYAETGTVSYLYKVVSTNAGVGAAMLHVTVDNDLLFSETPIAPDLCNTWLVGYLDKIPAGSHRVQIDQRPGADTNSYVLLGPITLAYGNNIPAHTHSGTGDLSLQLGVGASAPFSGTTVVGQNAAALAAQATAFGYAASADSNATALGANANAGAGSVAVGQGTIAYGRLANPAVTPAITEAGSVAVGKGASTGAVSAVAIGPSANARGTGSIAVGAAAQTGANGSAVALGQGAQALGIASVALGQGAVVGTGHDYSLAIGPGVQTTAAYQAMIGDSTTTVVVPGNFRQTGGSAQFAGTNGNLGFYGTAGVARPTVVGSRGGNAVLAQLLTVLDSMGLIKNGSVA